MHWISIAFNRHLFASIATLPDNAEEIRYNVALAVHVFDGDKLSGYLMKVNQRFRVIWSLDQNKDWCLSDKTEFQIFTFAKRNVLFVANCQHSSGWHLRIIDWTIQHKRYHQPWQKKHKNTNAHFFHYKRIDNAQSCQFKRNEITPACTFDWMHFDWCVNAVNFWTLQLTYHCTRCACAHIVRIKFIGFNLLNEMSITLLVYYLFALLIIQLNLIQPTVSVCTFLWWYKHSCINDGNTE